MKKYFPIIVIVILALTMMQRKKKQTNFNKIDYNQIENNLEENQYENVEFIDETGSYGLSYPGDWTLSDSAYKDEMIRADIFKGNDIGFQIRLFSNSNMSFKKFVNNSLEQFEKDMEKRWGSELNLEKRSFVEGRKNVYYRVIYNQIKDNGETWKYVEYIWNLDEKVLWFQSGYNLNKEPMGIEQLDEIAESVRF